MSETPVGVLKLLGLFIPGLKVVAQMGEYFRDFREEFAAVQTWEELGKPELTIETFRGA